MILRIFFCVLFRLVFKDVDVLSSSVGPGLILILEDRDGGCGGWRRRQRCLGLGLLG